MFQSDSINELAAALAAAQAEMKQPVKNSKNPHFGNRYADLNEVITTANPILARHGLAIVQTTDYSGGMVVLTTTLLHTSGQWVSGTYPVIPVKPDPQGYGSAMTYARRYAYSAIAGLAADDDDDGNAASSKPALPGSARAAKAPAPVAAKPPVPSPEAAPAATPATTGGSNGHRKPAAAAAVAPLAPAPVGVADTEIEDIADPDEPGDDASPAEDPGEFIVPLGKNAGKKVCELSRAALEWFANQMAATSEPARSLQAAARAYLAQLG